MLSLGYRCLQVLEPLCELVGLDALRKLRRLELLAEVDLLVVVVLAIEQALQVEVLGIELLSFVLALSLGALHDLEHVPLPSLH